MLRHREAEAGWEEARQEVIRRMVTCQRSAEVVDVWTTASPSISRSTCRPVGPCHHPWWFNCQRGHTAHQCTHRMRIHYHYADESWWPLG